VVEDIHGAHALRCIECIAEVRQARVIDEFDQVLLVIAEVTREVWATSGQGEEGAEKEDAPGRDSRAVVSLLRSCHRDGTLPRA
jgi:hypothetical protein